MKRVGNVQPILTGYRVPVYLELSRYCHVDLLFSASKAEKGFGNVIQPHAPAVRYFEIPTLRPFGDQVGMFQWGLLSYMRRNKPDAILTFANPRYLSFWTTLVVARLCGISVYAHGHGVYKKFRTGVLYRLMVKLMLRLVTSYIAYAPSVRESFAAHGFSDRKVSVADNSMKVAFTVLPEEKTGKERGILFIGRLRPDCNLSLLLRVVMRLRDEDGLPLTVHIVGSGERASQLRKECELNPLIHWHGELYDQEEIRKLSLDCFLGCYPGNAGLSVVHMMALSLPVVTHDNLSQHGPEVTFIQDGIHGAFYDHAEPEESLYRQLKVLATRPSTLAQMQRAAFGRYRDLVSPSLAERLWAIVSEKETAASKNLSTVLT
jgi:glycosyltransferase involved in cell wall biosynthesis